MPELPEVETVRVGLEKILKKPVRIERVELLRPDIRFPIPVDLPERFAGQPILAVRRRAKYLLVDTPRVSLLSHLGMTGSWRLVQPGEEDRHDHCYIHLTDGRRLAFRDPRRFGVLDLVESGRESEHRLLRNLGPEPLSAEFTGEALWKAARRRKTPVKVLIMNQEVVVGVGNIYASEALFRAGIRPSVLASQVSRARYEVLVEEIRAVLNEAILAGGSSIRDYRQASGEAGSFQSSFLVYDRDGEACPVCAYPLRQFVLGGRSTFWCKECQK